MSTEQLVHCRQHKTNEDAVVNPCSVSSSLLSSYSVYFDKSGDSYTLLNNLLW